MNKVLCFIGLTIVLLAILLGCDGITIQEPAPTLTAIQQLVADQNAYRNTTGQEQLQRGLDCTLYTVPQTATAIIGATLTNVGSFGFVGVFNQPNIGMNRASRPSGAPPRRRVRSTPRDGRESSGARRRTSRPLGPGHQARRGRPTDRRRCKSGRLMASPSGAEL